VWFSGVGFRCGFSGVGFQVSGFQVSVFWCRVFRRRFGIGY
jgi:hypothetical protein